MSDRPHRPGNESVSRAYYDDFATTYDRPRHSGYHAMIDELEFAAIESYARDKDVLEAGAGTGLILEKIARTARTAKGVDLSPGMAARARDRGLDVVVGSVTELPFPDASFDLVCSFKVLAHVPEIQQAIRELSRVTRPGGHLALEFYNPWSIRFLANRAIGPRSIGRGHTEADLYTRWDSPGAVARLLPPELTLLDYRGVRVFTPAAIAHRIPIVRDLIVRAERSVGDSPLKYFGGFLIALLEKKI